MYNARLFQKFKRSCSMIFNYKLWKKVGSSYSKIFQLTFKVPKLDFRKLKLKIVAEYLIYRSRNIA